MNTELGAKRLQLLHELLPAAKSFAVLVGLITPNTEYMIADMQRAASTLGGSIEVFSAASNSHFDNLSRRL